jgi:dTDP-4-dehydrorhamnose reductase
MGLDRADAESRVRAVSHAEVDAGAPRPRDVSLDARRAAQLLATPLPGIERGLAHALGA